jgi:hypothetical protein
LANGNEGVKTAVDRLHVTVPATGFSTLSVTVKVPVVTVPQVTTSEKTA